MRGHVQLVSFCLCLCAAAAAAATDADRFRASLRPRGYVNDFAGVLSSAQAAELENLLAELERKTTAEVAVVVLDSLQGGEVGDFANHLFEQWGIGKKGKDNGALLLAALQDRKVRIEVGYGLEGILPDARAGRILEQAVIPFFKDQRYAEGVMNGAMAVATIVAEDGGVSLTGARPVRVVPPAVPGVGFSWLHLLFLVILIVVVIRHPWLLLLLLRSGGRGGGFSGGGFGGGGFGGFGGGLSGGGGASRGW